MSQKHRTPILAGTAGLATVAALAVGGITRSIMQRRKGVLDRNIVEDFNAIGAGRSSIVAADDGVPLAVREFGRSDAPLTVVFVHGFCLRMQSWHFQYRDLSRQWGDGVRMVFYDQRGHGGSGRAPDDSCSFTQLAKDCSAVLRAVVPTGPIVLVGHSMGGMTVIALAGREPELFGPRVVGNVLIATAAEGLSRAGLGKGLQNPLVDAFRASVKKIPSAVQAGRGVTRGLMAPVYAAASFGPTYHSPSVSRFVETMLHETPINTVVNFLRALEDHDESAGLPAIARVPTTVICGYDDVVTPLRNSVALHNALPGSELVGVPETGHMVIMEAVDVVNDAIDRLVTRAREKPESA